MKPALKRFLSHFCFWREIGNEAKFSLIAVLPLFIALFLPVIYPSLISLTYSNQTVVERYAVVLDLDDSNISRDLILSMDATQGVEITRRVSSIDEGIQAVMSREADVFIFFPEDFSRRIKHFEQGNLKIYVYATNMMIYAAALTGIQTTILDKNVQLAIENVANPKGVTGDRALNIIDPIRYDKHIFYQPSMAYASFISPMLFIIVFNQMGLLILAFSIGYHREIDKEFRKRKLWYIDYFWRYLYYLCFVFLGTITVYFIVTPFFGWPCDNPVEMMKLILLLVISQMPLAIAFASFCKDRFTSFQMILGLSLFFFSISGYVWPREDTPVWVQKIQECFGVVPTAAAMRKIQYKNAMFLDCPDEILQLLKLHLIYLAISLVLVHRDLPAKPFIMLKNKIKPSKKAVKDDDDDDDECDDKTLIKEEAKAV